MTQSRVILHVDMDAFYASVEQRDRPELKGHPVVVGGDWGRGVVTAASYEARAFGIHSAMPGRRAAQLCPQAKFVRSRIEHYAMVGRQVREIFHRFTPVVQPLSLDEAFLDVTGTLRLFGDGATIGRLIQKTIREELDLPASVGIAPMKFVAKIASDLHKPNGFVEVTADEVQTFLDPLPVSRLWGVGAVGQTKLTRLGYQFIGDIRRVEEKLIKRQFGSWGEQLWKLANGIDPRAVVVDRAAKGIGHERTFEVDLTDEETLRGVVNYLSEQVARRLRACHRLAGTVSLKYRREDFKTYNRTETIRPATSSTRTIQQTAVGLLQRMRLEQPHPVRLIGVSLGNLSDEGAAVQMQLFDQESKQTDNRVDQLTDSITSKMGNSALHRGSSHAWIKRRPT